MRIITLTREVFDRLPEYSASLPTLAEVGIRWKCNHEPYGDRMPLWVMGEYVEHEDPNKVGIDWSLIVLKEKEQESPVPETACNPNADWLASEWERQGGPPIAGQEAHTRIVDNIEFFDQGLLYAPPMKISWFRHGGKTYVTIRRADGDLAHDDSG